MSHADFVHRNSRLGELSCQSPGGPRVVEMNVSHDDPVEGLDSGLAETSEDILDSRLRTRLDQGGLLVGYEEGPRDAWETVHPSIDDLIRRAHRVLSLEQPGNGVPREGSVCAE